MSDKEQFLKTHPLSIIATLRDLKTQGTAVMVSHARGQFITRVLEVLPESGQWVLDLSSVEYENRLVRETEALTIVAEPAAAKIEFTLSAPLVEQAWQGLPAFFAPLPASLYAIQRREYFRVNTPLSLDFCCNGTLPGYGDFSFRVKDISLGGICLYADKAFNGTLEERTLIRNVELDLAAFGRFTLDIQFVDVMVSQVLDRKGDTQSQTRFSFRFPMLSAVQERELQQVIFGLERLQHERNQRLRG
ncbi:flagellar brake protein [Nissabacter sp. SGAir0207]|uniref:flagellar brake protein n=1 Tax=Nissabacter sp. SGAir0207 TaxID=2126321 RepID=UPI001F0DF35A|nr:flagellar brake protein [Nissabacter sp. SGAir0207]